MSFASVHAAHPWADVLAAIQAKTDADVRRALARAETGALDLNDFQALVSPAAELVGMVMVCLTSNGQGTVPYGIIHL